MKPLFPYKTLFGDVSLRPTDVQIDGVPVFNRVTDDTRDIDLSGIERSTWKVAAMDFEMSAPAGEVSELTDVSAVVLVNCGLSNTRIAQALDPDEGSPGRWSGSIDLDRDSWFGRATARGIVTATVDGVPHRIVGTSETWLVSFDDLPRRPVNGSIQIRWVNFSEPPAEAKYLRDYDGDPWYLRIDPEEPILYLNNGFEGLEALLADRRRRPDAERALHNHARASLASEIWSSLFNAALDAVDLDESDVPIWPEEEWQKAVLAALLVRMYQEKGRDDGLVEAYTARHSLDGSATLQERLLPAAAAQVRLPKLLREGIRLLSSDPVDSGEEAT